MAQLVKLLDYITRYETKAFHYPTQFIRLKQEHWEQLMRQWEEENDLELLEQIPNDEKKTESETKEEKKKFLWKFFKKKESPILEERFIRTLPTTKKQLITYFLNQLMPFQLKWATSTITHTSFTDKNYMYEEKLKTLLQRLPDIYLIMYYPIFHVKNAPFESEIIIISPIGIEILTIVDAPHNARIVMTGERVWDVETEVKTTKLIDPTIALKRTEHVVRSILNKYGVDIPIQKTIMAESNYFLYDTAPYQTKLVGKNEYEDWMDEKKALHSPLKNVQLKAMEALLRHCQTTAVRRPEWEKDDDEFKTVADYEA